MFTIVSLLVSFFYIFMVIISRYNILWPVTMILHGGPGDKAIAIVWIILFISLFV